MCIIQEEIRATSTPGFALNGNDMETHRQPQPGHGTRWLAVHSPPPEATSVEERDFPTFFSFLCKLTTYQVNLQIR